MSDAAAPASAPAKTPKKKAAAKPKKPASHPKYGDMIKVSFLSLFLKEFFANLKLLDRYQEPLPII